MIVFFEIHEIIYIACTEGGFERSVNDPDNI